MLVVIMIMVIILIAMVLMVVISNNLILDTFEFALPGNYNNNIKICS